MGLFDRKDSKLPPPPAPTRRDANRWEFSKTARAQEDAGRRDVRTALREYLAEAAQQAEAEWKAEEEAGSGPESQPPAARPMPEPAQPRPPRTERKGLGLGLLPLLAFGLFLAFAVRALLEARESGEWIAAIGPILVLLFVAHGWWKLRQRRQAQHEDQEGR